MKFILLSILLLTTVAGYSQFGKKKKAKKEAEEAAAIVDPRDSKIDSLTTATYPSLAFSLFRSLFG